MSKRTRWEFLAVSSIALTIACSSTDEPPPPKQDAIEASLEAEPTRIAFGSSALLQWTTRNATEASLSEGETILAEGTEGELQVQPTLTTTYTLRASASGAADEVAEIVIEVEPVIETFEVVKAGVFSPGDQVELRWQTGGATSLELSTPEGEHLEVDGAAIGEGTAILPVGASGKFVLLAKSDELQTTQELSVSLRESPRIVDLDVEPGIVTAGQACPWIAGPIRRADPRQGARGPLGVSCPATSVGAEA